MSRFTDFIDHYIYEHKLYDQIGKDRTYAAVYDEVVFPHSDVLRSRDEYDEIANKIMDVIEEQYGLHLLRIYAYYPHIKTHGYCGFDLHDLYEYSIKEITKTVHGILSFLNITDKQDKELLEYFFKDAFSNKYGYIRPNNRLENIIMMIHEHFYDQKFAENLLDDLKWELKKSKDKYFINQDLLDKEVLHELYTVIGENIGFPEFRRSVFYDYDGYGNVVFALRE